MGIPVERLVLIKQGKINFTTLQLPVLLFKM